MKHEQKSRQTWQSKSQVNIFQTEYLSDGVKYWVFNTRPAFQKRVEL